MCPVVSVGIASALVEAQDWAMREFSTSTADVNRSFRLAEVVGSLALATDLATGQPLEHGCAERCWHVGWARSWAFGVTS